MIHVFIHSSNNDTTTVHVHVIWGGVCGVIFYFSRCVPPNFNLFLQLY